jgi:UDP-N-acetylglucosamine 3-dehydrogenase
MKIGVVGIGYWGRKVLSEYAELKREGRIDALWVCDTSAKARAQAKADAPIDTATPSLEKLLKNVDAIHIATRNDTHHAVAHAALEAGVHVLVEKPMTTTARTAYDLAERASAEGLVLQTGHIYRFNNAIRKVVQLVKDGHLGDVHYYKLQWTTKMPAPEGLSILWDLLPHPLDIINFIEGSWPQSFTGAARSYRRQGPSEVAFVEALYPKNKIAAIELSWLRPIRSRTLEIVGSQRDAIIDCVGQTITTIKGDTQRNIKVKANNTIREETLHFLKSIDSGKNPLNSAIIGARNVEAVENAVRQLEVSS